MLSSIRAQELLVGIPEDRLHADSRDDVRLRLLGELCLSAWRRGARNWVAGRGQDRRHGRGGVTALARRADEAFDAIPASLTPAMP